MCVQFARQRLYSSVDFVKASIIVGLQNCQDKTSPEEFLRQQQEAIEQFLNSYSERKVAAKQKKASLQDLKSIKRMHPEVQLEEEGQYTMFGLLETFN